VQRFVDDEPRLVVDAGGEVQRVAVAGLAGGLQDGVDGVDVRGATAERTAFVS
jgi:hypothetical protein